MIVEFDWEEEAFVLEVLLDMMACGPLVVERFVVFVHPAVRGAAFLEDVDVK